MGIKHIGDRTIENWSVDGIHGLLQRLVILQNLLRASGNVVMTWMHVVTIDTLNKAYIIYIYM